jgi:hypothetical protein
VTQIAVRWLDPSDDVAGVGITQKRILFSRSDQPVLPTTQAVEKRSARVGGRELTLTIR